MGTGEGQGSGLLTRQSRQRQEGEGKTPTSATTQLTHPSPDGNANASSCLTPIPLSIPSCMAPPPGSLSGQRHPAFPMVLLPPHPSFKVPDVIPARTLGAPRAGTGLTFSHCMYGAWGMGMAKNEEPQGAWVVEGLTLGLCSDHDLRVMGSSPVSGLALSTDSARDSLSSSVLPPASLTLSLK